MICVGFLNRLDDRVIGPNGQPADPRRMRAGHWFGVAITLTVVIAGFLASGSNNPAVWPLAGMAIGSVVMGTRKVTARAAATSGTGGEGDASAAHEATESDIHDLSGRILDAEQQRK
jgi:hypothetical protein